jgi:hypothetical protein
MNSLPRLSKKHQEQIAACLDILDTRIYSQREIEEILVRNWEQWRLPLNVGIPNLLDYLIKNLELKKSFSNLQTMIRNMFDTHGGKYQFIR